jgi:hypothetical protein
MFEELITQDDAERIGIEIRKVLEARLH